MSNDYFPFIANIPLINNNGKVRFELNKGSLKSKTIIIDKKEINVDYTKKYELKDLIDDIYYTFVIMSEGLAEFFYFLLCDIIIPVKNPIKLFKFDSLSDATLSKRYKNYKHEIKTYDDLFQVIGTEKKVIYSDKKEPRQIKILHKILKLRLRVENDRLIFGYV